MNYEEIQSKSDDQLSKQLLDLKKEQMNLRFQKATGQMEKPNRLREVKTTIARVQTEMSSRKNAAAKESK